MRNAEQTAVTGRYLPLYESGELARRVDAAVDMLRACNVCPHECGVDRFGSERGICKTGWDIKVGAAVPHFGEEPVLVGSHGVGNLFVSSCNLKCKYCQNYDISHLRHGRDSTVEDLAACMMRLQGAGCRFVGWVSPSHVAPQLLAGLLRAVEQGFDRPIIYNTSSWDSLETLRLMDGIVSVYLPDMKYADDEVGLRLSGCKEYVRHSRAAVEEMYRQVGDLEFDDLGLAKSGLLVRHLVLPNDLAGSWDTLSWLRIELGRNIGLSVMSQYAPIAKVMGNTELNRCVTKDEYERVLDMVAQLGFRNVFTQEFEAQQIGMPSFSERVPFEWPERENTESLSW
jgi:putative pyruvate formate lyase activating enzyme